MPRGAALFKFFDAIDKNLRIILTALEKFFDAAHDDDNEGKFTQSMVESLRTEFPWCNVMIVHGSHDRNLAGEAHRHAELPISFGRTYGYEIYIFDSGTFTLHSDGGFQNWCFNGNYKRDGGNVTFFDIPDQEPVETPPEPTLPPPQPVRRHRDGVYLVNCQRGNEYSSGIAYYKNLRDGGNFGQRPDDYVDVVHGSWVDWEQAGQVTFKNGTKFHWSIINDAQQKQDFSRIGFADNSYVQYWLYKDTKKELYEVDGWHCNAIYWGF